MVKKQTYIPVSNIVPLVFRDGASLLELIHGLAKYVQDTLEPSLKHVVDGVVAEMEAQMDQAKADYVAGVQEFQKIHDAFMDDVEASLRALNDTVVADLATDHESYLGRALREIFLENSGVDDAVAGHLRDENSATRTVVETLLDTVDVSDDIEQLKSDIEDDLAIMLHRRDVRRVAVSHEKYGVTAGDVSSLRSAIQRVSEHEILTLPVDMEFTTDEVIEVGRPVHIRGGVIRGRQNIINVTSSGVVLEDMRIIGSGVDQLERLSAAIRFDGSQNNLLDATVRNVSIEGVGFTGVHLEWCKNFVVENCHISHFKYAGIGVSSGFDGVIRDNVVEHAHSTDRDGHNSYGVYVSNKVENGVQSISENVEIYGNKIHNIPNWEGIDTHNGININIHDNVITSCRRGIALVSNMGSTNTGVRDCRVIGNYVDCKGFSTEHFNTSTGVTLQSSSTGLGVNAIIIGNTVRNSDTPVTFGQDLPERYDYDKCVVHSNVGDPGQPVNGTAYDTGWVNPHEFVTLAGGVTLHQQDSFRMRVVGDTTGRTVYGRGRVSRGASDLILRVLNSHSHLIPHGAAFAGHQNKHVIGRCALISNGATASLYLHDDRRIRIGDESSGFGSGTVVLDFMWRIGNDGA